MYLTRLKFHEQRNPISRKSRFRQNFISVSVPINNISRPVHCKFRSVYVAICINVGMYYYIGKQIEKYFDSIGANLTVSKFCVQVNCAIYIYN